jgi:Phosphatidylserine decarboxylase
VASGVLEVIAPHCAALPGGGDPSTGWTQRAELTDLFGTALLREGPTPLEPTVYQAFLSALNYHRWHSPVSGTVVQAFVKDGTYYSEADIEGEDPAGPNNSQGYLTQVATRALFCIAADDPRIGLICFMLVGMAEVSSCVIDPRITPGSHVIKGQELGYFQYGGSTHCLIFRPGVIKDVAIGAIPQPTNPHAPLVMVCSKLATAAWPTVRDAHVAAGGRCVAIGLIAGEL